MIGNWIKQKIRDNNHEKAANEIDGFLMAIKGKSDNEIAMLMAVATLIRLNLATNGELPHYVLQGKGTQTEQNNSLRYLVSIIRQFQKSNQAFDAAGGMIWLHSLKVHNYPELSTSIEALWVELQRGFPQLEEKFAEIAKLTGKKTPKAALKGCRYIPEWIESTT